MRVITSEIPGVLIVEPEVFGDERGFFYESYNERAFIEQAGIAYEQHFAITSYAAPVVHAEADYRLPIRPGEHLTVEVRLERLGVSSMTMAFRVLGPEGEERATGRETHVTVDPGRFVSIPIPAELRAALAPIAESETPQTVR